MRQKEREFILSAINFLSPIDEQLAELAKEIHPEKEFIEFIKWNRIGGIIYTVFSENGNESYLPMEMQAELKSIYTKNLQQNEDMVVMLKDLTSFLEDSKFPYTFLKGSYLIPFLYRKGMRSSNDVDILISQSDIDILDEVLISHGFEQKIEKNGELVAASRMEKLFVRMNYGELVPYFKEYNLPEIRNGCLDINISLDFQVKNNSESVESILKNTVNYTHADGLTIHTLSSVNFFLHLCAHLYKEAKIYNWVAENRDTLLYKFCDIYLYLKTFGDEQFWKELEEVFLVYGLEKACYYTIYIAQQLFHDLRVSSVDEFLNKNRPTDTSFLNQIFWPLKNKLFEYDLSIENWVFCEDKLAYLKEIPLKRNAI